MWLVMVFSELPFLCPFVDVHQFHGEWHAVLGGFFSLIILHVLVLIPSWMSWVTF